MRRMLTAKLQNRSGVLNRFTGVLSRRQVNIESISVGATEDPNVSRITIIIDVASHDEVEQIIKQLNRQIDVIRIRDITDKPHLEREVILVKMSAPAEKRAEILAIIQPFRATVVDVAPSSITIQMTGNAEKSEVCLQSKGSQHRFCPFCWQIRYVELHTQLLDAKLFQFEAQHLIVSQER